MHASSATAKPTATPPGAGGRILIAEDSPTNAMVARVILEQAGFAVTCAADGALAIAALENGDFDLVLMDVVMPEMDGLEATAKIRRRGDTKAGLPVVAMTGHTSEADRRRCLEAGMNDFVSKPVTKDSLLAAVGKWLGAGDRPAVLDTRAVERLERDSGTELMPRLVVTFIKESAARLDRILGAAKAGELTTVEREASEIEDAAVAFGALGLQRTAHALVQACRSGDTAASDKIVRTLPKAIYDASKALADRYSGAG